MRNTGTIKYENMSDRAQAVIDATLLHYRGAFAEALLNGKAPPAPERDKRLPNHEGKTPNAVGAMMNMASELNRRQRKRLVSMLMNDDIGNHRLTSSDRVRLKNRIQPGEKQAYAKRHPLEDAFASIYGHPEAFKNKGERELEDWMRGQLGDFFPGLRFADDGRPDDAEPGDPSPDKGDPEPTSPVPGTPPQQQFLHLNIDEIECVDDTNGELGPDEISYSGVATDGPMAGFIDPSAVGGVLLEIRDAGAFRAGDTRNETALTPFHSYDLSGLSMPHLFVVHLCMAETDRTSSVWTAFPMFMNFFFQDIQAEALNLWQVYLITIPGTTLAGAGIGLHAGGPIGAAIGAAIGVLLGTVLTYVFNGNSDDIFSPETIWLQLGTDPLSFEPFNGNSRTSTVATELRGDGGTYNIHHHWALSGFSTAGPGDSDADAIA